MKLQSIIIAIGFVLSSVFLSAQEITTYENFGRTLNAGAGYSYYHYVGYPVVTFHADFEMQIAKNITAAPFLATYAYKSNVYWGNTIGAQRFYDYSETVVAGGLKVSYYFDELLNASPNWDFYAAGSLGLIYRKTTWEAGYGGLQNISPGTGPLFLDLHLGTEWHFSKRIGLQLDASTGVSTLGLSFHF